MPFWLAESHAEATNFVGMPKDEGIHFLGLQWIADLVGTKRGTQSVDVYPKW